MDHDLLKVLHLSMYDPVRVECMRHVSAARTLFKSALEAAASANIMPGGSLSMQEQILQGVAMPSRYEQVQVA